MFNWINSHGLEVMFFYLMFAGIVGTMPPVPASAGYWSRWAYAALHGLSMNIRQALSLAKINLPSEQDNEPKAGS